MSYSDLNAHVATLVKHGDALGGDAKAAADTFAIGIAALQGFLDKASTISKPSQDGMMEMLKEVSAAMSGADELQTNRKSGFPLHAKMIADAMQSFTWVFESKPVPYIEEYAGTVSFTANKIMSTTKAAVDATEHLQYCKALQGAMKALAVLVKQEHTTGVHWGGKMRGAGHPGGEASAPKVDPATTSSPILEKLTAAAAAHSPEVQQMATFVAAAFQQHDALVAKAATMTRPDDMTSFLQPLADAMGAASEFAEKNRRAKDFMILDVLSQVVGLCAWVSLKEKPLPFVKDNAEPVAFLYNKLLVASKDNREIVAAVKELIAYVQTLVNDGHRICLSFAHSAATHADPHAGASSQSSASTTVAPAFATLRHLAEPIDRMLADASSQLHELAAALDQFLATAATSPKPAAVGPMLKGMEPLIVQLNAFVDANERHKTLSTHAQAVGQAVNLFNWVCVAQPLPFCEETLGSYDFFSNKIMVANKGKPDAEWAKALRGGLATVVALVKANHRTGVSWAASAAAAAPPAAGGPAPRKGPPGPPPPPPPPPPASRPAASSKGGGSGGSISALFAEINSKGGSITSGLRHVTDDQKNYKQKDRETRTVSGADLAKRKKKSAHFWAPPTGAPKMALEGDKKWIVEYQCGPDNDEDDLPCIDIAADKKHAIFINRCNNVFVRVEGKCNSIQVVECLKLQLQLADSVGPIEITSSQSTTVLVTGLCPSIMASKVKGATVHLAGSTETEFVASCSSNLLVTYVGVDDAGEKNTFELAVPEQFQTNITRNKLVTKPVEHGS